MRCEVCSVEFDSARSDTKYCSPKCRKQAFNKRSVGTDSTNGTDNMIVEERIIPERFEFYTISKTNGMGRTKDEKSKIRKAVYWYDVPIAAIPVIKKDYPEMPNYMNGRQYFLWWKNEFKTKGGSPVLVNPL